MASRNHDQDNPRKPRRRKQHAQPRRGYNKRDSQVPRSLLITVVLLVGVTAWALYTLSQVEVGKSRTQRDASGLQVIDKGRDALANEKKPINDDSEYDFYVMLRDFEVAVRDDGIYQSAREKRDEVYYLIQAGSFKTGQQAEQRRAELALLGLAAKVDHNTNSRGERWYRVRLGPFTSRRDVAETRTTMIENGIEAMVMTRKKS